MRRINSTSQVIAKEIATHYDGVRGKRHNGWYCLRDTGLLTHPERLSSIVVGHINSGSKVGATAIRIGEAVAELSGVEFIWRARLDIGLFLLQCSVSSTLYELRRGDGTAPTSSRSTEPYRIYSVGTPAQPTLGFLSTSGPFPKWESNLDADGRKLLQSDCYTPEVDPTKTWVHAVHKVESIGFRINQAVLETMQRIGIHETNPIKQVQQEEILRTAERLKDSTFFHRAHVDRRGRIYISRSPINYQKGDIARALLEFADGVPLTAEGLDAIYLSIANHSGEKGDIQDRIMFAKDNHDRWISYADGSSDEWMGAPAPWQLLRASIELTTTKVGDTSNLIVEIDQASSGLAWQSIVMSDENLASMTNLQGGHEDIYTIISNSLDIPASATERRLIAKKCGMVRGYGGGARKIASQLRDEARLNPESVPYLATLDLEYTKDKRGDSVPSKDFISIAETAIRTLEEVAPATKEYSKAVRRFFKSRLDSLPYVQWLSPSGFFCRVRKEKGDKVLGDIRINSRRIRIVAYAPSGELDYDKMLTGSLANVIHSLDASLCHLTLANAEHQITPIHDAFCSHASNVFQTQQALMDALVLIESMNPSLCLSAYDHDDKITWSELQAQDAMQDYLHGINQPTTTVVIPTATNIFS